MRRILEKFRKLKKPQDSYLTFTDTNERTITGITDPMPSALAHAATQATSTSVSVNFAHWIIYWHKILSFHCQSGARGSCFCFRADRLMRHRSCAIRY